MPIFIIFFVLCSMFFQLNAEFDAGKCTLQEWASECFKNYKEYSEGASFTEPKPILSFKDFQKILEEFNTKIQEAPYVIKVTNEKIFSDKQDLISETTKINPGQDTKIKDDLHNIKITKNKESFSDGSELRPDTVIIDPYIQKIKIDPKSKICFIGDIHGSIHSLLRDLLRLVSLGYLKNDFSISENKKFYMVFTGDYVDRGRYGIEVIFTLLKLKLKNMEKVFLLKGNHEISHIYEDNGFEDEMFKKFSGKKAHPFDEFCKLLPLALFIGSGQDSQNNNQPFWVQCCHGGIEPTFKPEDLKNFLKSEDTILNLKNKLFQDKLELCVVKEFKGIFGMFNLDEDNGFTWCDFCESPQCKDESHQCKDECPSNPYNRPGRGYMIHSKNKILGQYENMSKYLNSYGIKAIFRGHQHSTYGLKIGGETHWESFGKKSIISPGPLPTQAQQKESLGFKISEINYPVFTFSTASEGVGLDYDCFGILTTAEKLEDWQLLPYEFSLAPNVYAEYARKAAHNIKFVKITSFNSNVENLDDPINFEFVKPNTDGTNPVTDPVPMDLFKESVEHKHLPLEIKLQELKANLSKLNNKLSLLQQKLMALRKKLPA